MFEELSCHVLSNNVKETKRENTKKQNKTQAVEVIYDELNSK